MNVYAFLLLSLYILLPCVNLGIAISGRASKLRLYLVLFIAVTLFHNSGYFIEATAKDVGAVFAAAQFEFLFGNLSLVMFFYFIREWCQAKFPKWFYILFNLFAGVAAMMAITSGTHDFFFTVDGITKAKGLLQLTQPELSYGFFEYVMYAYYLITYTIMGFMITKAYRRTSDKKGRRALLLFAVAGLSPIVCEFLYAFGAITKIDPTPTGYFVSQCVLVWCMAGEKVLDVLQNAFDLIAYSMDGALIVVDGSEKLIYSNDAANRSIAGLKNGARLPNEISALFEAGNHGDEIEIGKSVYQCRISVLKDRDRLRGKVALLTDVSHIHKLKELLEEENKRITSDLELAASIQLNALPRLFPPWPDRTDFRIFATMRPAKEVGGDFYDLFLVDETHLALVIADVSGKGVPAALFMMNAKACIRDHMMAGMAPDMAFIETNNQLCAGNDAGMFVTAWAILIDMRTGDASFVNAGHNPPYLRHIDGAWEQIKSRPNMVLADTSGIKYRLNKVKISIGDQLFLYTDGIVEAQNADAALYGDSRLLTALNANSALSPEELLPVIQNDVDSFAGEASQFDDMTMLSLRIDDMMQTLTVKATLASCEEVSRFIREWLEKRGFDTRTVRRILVAQDEIFSNIARYAYANKPEGGMATVEVYTQGKYIVITFVDSGVPFNPLDVTRKKREYEDEWSEGGDGIFIVKKTMDQVAYEYRDEQNRFTMKKLMNR